jgi:dTDP-4-dehydrorhamnose reductase
MRILVFGAGGMLGTDVVVAARGANHEVVALSRADLDVTDRDAVAAAVAEAAPAAVVNCAAFTNVDAAEEDEAEASRVNAEGARNVAEAAAVVGAAVLYPSTDYVFDGAKSEPYVESDAPRPLSAYGRSKFAGEHETAAANPRHYVVRSAWLFGTGGPNFVDTMLTIGSAQGQVLVVRDQIGSPTFTGHLASALVRVLDTHAFGLHHMAGAGECSWYELALEIFSQSGIDCRVLSCTTEELGRPAPRPPYSALGSELEGPIELPEWREGLRAYLAERAVTA